MQILLNQVETSQAVIESIRDRLSLLDTDVIVVELTEDGAHILINEEAGETPAKTDGEKSAPRRQRQRRGSNKEATAQEPESKQTPEATAVVATTAETAPVSEPVTPEVAGETTQEQSVPGTDVEPDQQTPVDPSPEVATTVAVEEPAQEPEQAAVEPEAQEPALEEEPVRPKQSLFANLRKPSNQ